MLTEKNSPRKTGKRSIKKAVANTFALFTFLILFVTIVTGFVFHVYASLREYKDSLNGIASYTVSQVGLEYLEDLYQKTKTMYYSMPDDLQKDPFTDEFRKTVKPLLDKEYFKKRDILSACRESTNISNIYFGFYDEKNSRFVLVLDGDILEYFYIPGQYISNENGYLESPEIMKYIMYSTWAFSFAHTDMIGYSVTDYIPLYHKDGSPLGIIAIDTSIKEFFDELLVFALIFIPFLTILIYILSRFISRSVEKRFIIPINALAEAARTYTERDKVNDPENSSYFNEVSIEFNDELEELKDTMAEMEKDIHLSIQEVRRASAEKERLSAELDIAAAIQMDTLPTVFPERDNFDLYASMTPAKAVGGDFYDFFMTDDDHLALVMADVSGKGIPAALFMMKGKEKIKNRALKGGKPSEILEYVNKELSKDNLNFMFITIWLGILEISTGRLTASNAGHENPFITDETGTFRKYDDPHGFVCGALEDINYTDYSISLTKGGSIFVFTDGIAEAMNEKDELFGLERLETSLNEHRKASARELTELLSKDIRRFAGEAEQSDDITMLCLKIN